MALFTSRTSAFWSGATVAAFALELLLFSYLRGYFGPLLSAVVFLGASLLVTYAAYRALRDQPYEWALRPTGARRADWRWVAAAALLLLAFYPRLDAIITQFPVDITMSDVLPVIEVYLRRFQNGEPVYALITNFSYHLPAGYLPTFWMPFLLPDALNIDYRWVGFWSFGVGVLLYAFRLGQLRPDLYEGAFKLLLPVLPVLYLVGADAHILGLSIESLVIGYYFVLVAGILSKSPVLRAAGLVLCLLSRFSLLFWAPFYLWLIYRHEGPRAALWVAGLTALGVLALYVLPFGATGITQFFEGQSYYTGAALGEWGSNLNDQGLPYQLFNGMGMAAFFYRYFPGELLARINALRAVHLLMTVSSVAVLALAYWLRRHRLRLDYRYIALLALKLNLTLFYAFIQVPYDNLLLLVVFLSAWLILCLRPVPTAAEPAQI
ncbi:hypothetical protein GCM10027048_09310 [Hymenobacter coalescens]